MSERNVRSSFAIPAKHIPYVIGPKGRNIQAICKGSGTSININTESADIRRRFKTQWAYAGIYGNPEQVDRARMLLLISCMEAAVFEDRGTQNSTKVERVTKGSI